MLRNKRFILLLLCFISAVQAEDTRRYNIGLLIVATGQYTKFVAPLIASAQQYFCPNHNVTYFVFTDGNITTGDHIVRIEQKKLGWPYDTMMRFAMYYNARDILKEMDYLFAIDADMRFVDYAGDEILSDRVGTLHPGFVGRRGTYETNSRSLAYVGPAEGSYYFAGGFNGGSSVEFLNMAEIISARIYKDLENKVIAVWHDESHLNRYFIDNPPTCILSPSYCYPESWHLSYQKRLLALDKNHGEIRK